MLYCKKLDENAILPSVAHPGEDLGYDIYAVEKTYVFPNNGPTKVKTGIAARFIDNYKNDTNFGLLIRDRSSVASKGLMVSAGVIDAGYTGEILILLNNTTQGTYVIEAGDKIAQMIPVKVRTEYGAKLVDELPTSSRADKGFGSSDKIAEGK